MRFIERIEEQADRLHQLILDMLQIARVESGEEAFDIIDVRIGDVVNACIAQYSASAEQKQIQLLTEPPAKPAAGALAVRADQEGVRAILDNLISNAINYTPEGGRVTIRWRLADQLRFTLMTSTLTTGISKRCTASHWRSRRIE